MADGTFRTRPSLSPSPTAIAFPEFDATYMEGLDLLPFQEPFPRQDISPQYSYPANAHTSYPYANLHGPQQYSSAYQSTYHQFDNMSQHGYAGGYSSQIPYSSHGSASNSSHYYNPGNFNPYGMTSHHVPTNHDSSKAHRNHQHNFSNLLNPSTPSFVPSTPTLSGRGTSLSMTKTVVHGLRATPPTGPRAMLSPYEAPRKLDVMDQHSRPTGRTSTTRVDKSLKDIIITSAGISRNVVVLREMRSPAGTTYKEESGEFAADKYNFTAHWASMNEADKRDFCQRNYFEMVIDVAAVEEGARIEDKGYGKAKMAGRVNDGKKIDTKSPLDLLQANLAKLAFQNEQEHDGGISLKEQLAQGQSLYGKGPSKREEESGSTSTQVTKYHNNNLAIPAINMFSAIAALGPCFTHYTTTLFVTLKFSSTGPLIPTHFPTLPNPYAANDTPSLPSGAIDTQSTPLFRHLSHLVSVLESFTSLTRLDITLNTPANMPKPLTVEQLDHILPFYDLTSFTKWRIWWRAEYMTHAEMVTQWPIAHLNSEWGKICTWRDWICDEEEKEEVVGMRGRSIKKRTREGGNERKHWEAEFGLKTVLALGH